MEDPKVVRQPVNNQAISVVNDYVIGLVAARHRADSHAWVRLITDMSRELSEMGIDPECFYPTVLNCMTEFACALVNQFADCHDLSTEEFIQNMAVNRLMPDDN